MAKHLNILPQFWNRIALGRGLRICAMFSGVALLSVAALAQTVTPPPPPPPSQAASPAQAAATAEPGQRPDSAIAEDVNNKLMASDTLRPLGLGIWVHGGTATLTGSVPTKDLREQAVSMVKSVDGVQNVDDKIVIGPAQQPLPAYSGENGGQPGYQGAPPPPPPPENDEDQNAPLTPPAGYGQNQNAPLTPPPGYGERPRSGMVTIQPETPIFVMVMRTIDSHHTKVGAQFHGVVVQNVIVRNGVIAIPRGADVTGTVVDSRGPGHLKGRPHLALQLISLNVADANYPLSSYIWARGGPGKGGQSAANIGGGAVTGAFIGGAVGGGPTALLGGLLGGLGGAGLSSLSSGPRLIVPAESVVTFYLNAPVTVREPNMGEIRELGSHVPPAAYGRPGYRYPHPGYYPPPYYPPPGAPPGGYPY